MHQQMVFTDDTQPYIMSILSLLQLMLLYSFIYSFCHVRFQSYWCQIRLIEAFKSDTYCSVVLNRNIAMSINELTISYLPHIVMVQIIRSINHNMLKGDMVLFKKMRVVSQARPIVGSIEQMKENVTHQLSYIVLNLPTENNAENTITICSTAQCIIVGKTNGKQKSVFSLFAA